MGFGLFGLLTVTGQGQYATQTISLSKGWNAIYLQVQPEDSSCEAVFANWPVSSVNLFNGGRALPQFTENPSEPLNLTAEYSTWVQGGEAGANSLNNVIAGNAYCVFAKEIMPPRLLTGRPAVPRIDWMTGTAATNVFNLVGFAQDGTAKFGSYLAGAGFAMSKLSVYSVSGTNMAGPTFSMVGGFGGVSTVAITPGKAYLIACDKVSTFSGPVKVYPAGTGGILFPATSSRQTLRMRNESGSNLTVTLTLQASAAAPSGVTPLLPALRFFDYLTGWTNVLHPRILQAGEEWTLPMAVDRTGMAEGQLYGGLLVCSDTAGGRVTIPVEAEYGQPDEARAPWPAGLWVGKASLDKVSQVLAGGEINTGAEAGGTLELRLILHVGTDGSCRLLQRVIIAGAEDTNGNWNAALYLDEKKVPAGMKSARISSVAFGLKNNIAWDGAGGFGSQLRFTYTLAADDPVNPFRHPYHPDHNGLDYDFKTKLPTGDNPQNYMGEIKPELFSISNTVRLVWTTAPAAGGGSVLWNPSGKVSGDVYFQVEGLRREGAVLMQGLFELQRVSQVGALSQE